MSIEKMPSDIYYMINQQLETADLQQMILAGVFDTSDIQPDSGELVISIQKLISRMPTDALRYKKFNSLAIVVPHEHLNLIYMLPYVVNNGINIARLQFRFANRGFANLVDIPTVKHVVFDALAEFGGYMPSVTSAYIYENLHYTADLVFPNLTSVSVKHPFSIDRFIYPHTRYETRGFKNVTIDGRVRESVHIENENTSIHPSIYIINTPIKRFSYIATGYTQHITFRLEKSVDVLILDIQRGTNVLIKCAPGAVIGNAAFRNCAFMQSVTVQQTAYISDCNVRTGVLICNKVISGSKWGEDSEYVVYDHNGAKISSSMIANTYKQYYIAATSAGIGPLITAAGSPLEEQIVNWASRKAAATLLKEGIPESFKIEHLTYESAIECAFDKMRITGDSDDSDISDVNYYRGGSDVGSTSDASDASDDSSASDDRDDRYYSAADYDNLAD